MEVKEILEAKLAELDAKFSNDEETISWGANPGCKLCKGYCTPAEFTN